MNRSFLPIFTMTLMLALASPWSSYGDPPTKVRFATFNVALNRPESGALARELASGDSEQAARIAEIIQRVRPDILLLNEVDHDDQHEAIRHLREQFLAVGQNGQTPIEYAFMFTDKVNTGQPSQRDLDKDGKLQEPEDALGYGRFPGQYGMVVLSKYPIRSEEIRTFRNFLWQQMPDALLPVSQGQPFYDQEDLAVLPLSSKSHWDVPIDCPGGVVHFLASHPTPPVFDGEEDRNGRRNHDEIRLFADYIDPDRGGYLVDDAGRQGGLPEGAHFVIVGDLNADPRDGQSHDHAIQQLLDHPQVQAEPVPTSEGGKVAAASQGEANVNHQGDPAHDTGDFSDRSVGNLRIDYALPSSELKVIDQGVFWPASGAAAELAAASDHRLVWIDVTLPEGSQP